MEYLFGVVPVALNLFELNRTSTAWRLTTEVQTLGFALTKHPLAVMNMNYTHSNVVERMRNGQRATVAGIVITRQKPPTKSGKRIIFLTMQDEAGLIDVTVFPDE